MDATEDELMNISSQLKDVEKEAKVSQNTLNELQGVKAKMDAFTKTTILLEKEMESLIVEELRQKNLHAEIKERKFLLEEDIKKSRWKLRNLSGDAAETAEDNAIKALENEISEEKALQETIHNLMLQQKQVELLHRRLLGNFQDSDVTMMHNTINLYNEDLANLKEKLNEVEHKLDHANKEDEERSEQLRMIIEEADLSEQMISEAEEDIMHLKTRIEQLKASQNETEEEIKSLEVLQELTGFSNGCVITTEHNYRVGKQQLKRMTLELQKLKSDKQKLTLKEQVAYDECVMQLSIFKERAASISESMNILIEGIEKTKNRVQEANEATFDAIRHSFKESCKMLLPNMSVDLIKIGKLVEHGVKMSFRNHSSKSSDANDHHWKQNLEELSGGQRTMMCLAFILMVAKSQQASLYIMDEVDAALDEQNQTRIAALIRKYIGDKSQVICVSHNVSFQKHCDTILTISKQEGTVILQRTELESVAQEKTPKHS
ncbi:hypothetical protein O6H91_15G085300 [Diphasiastrum complanatum]|uniref:Uncharacterized protein n=1 Tax=Diphasiastrum complanatum TaxID=34168 RepID=A0ACC2BKI1_DIPCM|nr:hypothetical protein O6H91_15G085300 [Diphasiastrum complanatum]